MQLNCIIVSNVRYRYATTVLLFPMLDVDIRICNRTVLLFPMLEICNRTVLSFPMLDVDMQQNCIIVSNVRCRYATELYYRFQC